MPAKGDTMRSHSQTLDVIKAFIERWKGRGYEKGERHSGV